MNLDPSTLVPMIDALVVRGLILRGQDPDDRRRIPLILTDEGAKIIRQAEPFDEDSVFIESLHDG
jgi:DNA-binding MarR family transcriptional regulator